MLKQKSHHLIAADSCLFQITYQPANTTIEQVEKTQPSAHLGKQKQCYVAINSNTSYCYIVKLSSQTTRETLICFIISYEAFHHTTSKVCQGSIKQHCAWLIIFSYPQGLSPGKGLCDNRTTVSSQTEHPGLCSDIYCRFKAVAQKQSLFLRPQ